MGRCTPPAPPVRGHRCRCCSRNHGGITGFPTVAGGKDCWNQVRWLAGRPPGGRSQCPANVRFLVIVLRSSSRRGVWPHRYYITIIITILLLALAATAAAFASVSYKTSSSNNVRSIHAPSREDRRRCDFTRHAVFTRLQRPVVTRAAAGIRVIVVTRDAPSALRVQYIIYSFVI